MTTKTIQALVEAYRATGRVALIYPRLRSVSLNGMASISYKEAAAKIKTTLAQTA